MRDITIATRGSKLALWQANFVKDSLEKQYAGMRVTLLIVKTKGDIILDVPLAKVGGKGLFVKEIEEALLDERADVAVHSMKDVPMELPEPLVLGVIPQRENPADLFLSAHHKNLLALPQGATVGTSSLRRQAQLLAIRPDLHVVSLRGNIDTRLKKLTEGHYDAIIMAAAGMARLNLSAPYMEILAPAFLPAAGQGAIGLEYRADKPELHSLFSFLNHPKTHTCVLAERAFLRALDGGCQVPIAAFATLSGEELSLEGMVASPNGKEMYRASSQSPASGAVSLGENLALELKNSGAGAVIEEFYKA